MWRSAARDWQRRRRYRLFDYLRSFSRDVSHITFSPMLAAASEEDAAAALLEILDHSAELAEVPVFLLETDPWGEAVFNAFDEVARRLAAGEYPDLAGRIHLVSLAGVFDGAGEDYFLLDGHPNARGHAKIATRLEQALLVAGLLGDRERRQLRSDGPQGPARAPNSSSLSRPTFQRKSPGSL